MSANTLSDEILDHVNRLSVDKQKAVLEFVRGLDKPGRKGISGPELFALAREINFDPEDLRQISEAIDEWCEHIDEPREINFNG